MDHLKADIEQHFSNWKVPATQSKEAAWEMLSKKIERPRKPAVNRLPLLTWSGMAAAILILAFLVVSQWLDFPSSVINPTIFSQSVLLPDSSQVGLKAYSEIEYRYRKNGKRLVKLKGEAFFQVTQGKTFEVEFPGGELTVLGTSFNIRAYSDVSGRIDCFSGKVKLHVNRQELILEKNQAIIYSESAVEGPLPFDPDKIRSLPDNTYSWTNRPLKEILLLICQREGYLPVAPETILNKRFWGELDLSRPEQALQILSTAMNFTYQIDGNKLKIFEKE